MNPVQPIKNANGFALVWLVTTLPLIVAVLLGIFLLATTLNLHLRTQYRCRDEVLKQQELLAEKINTMEQLNATIQTVHAVYMALQLGQLVPPFTGLATVGVNGLRVMKITLNLQQEALAQWIRTMLLLRTPRGTHAINRALQDDFHFDRLTRVVVHGARPKVRLFRTQRLDEYSKLLVPLENLPQLTELQWRWSLSPHNILPETLMASTRKALSQNPIRERRRADGGYHVLKGSCAAHLDKEEKWKVYLGEAKPWLKPLSL